MESSWKNTIYVNLRFWRIEKSRKCMSRVPVCFDFVRLLVRCFMCFLLFFRCSFRCFVKMWVHILKILLRRWGLKMINFPLIKQRRAWIWIAYISKTWKGNLIFFLFSGNGNPKPFYFQGRESPNFLFSNKGRKGII